MHGDVLFAISRHNSARDAGIAREGYERDAMATELEMGRVWPSGVDRTLFTTVGDGMVSTA